MSKRKVLESSSNLSQKRKLKRSRVMIEPRFINSIIVYRPKLSVFSFSGKLL